MRARGEGRISRVVGLGAPGEGRELGWVSGWAPRPLPAAGVSAAVRRAPRGGAPPVPMEAARRSRAERLPAGFGAVRTKPTRASAPWGGAGAGGGISLTARRGAGGPRPGGLCSAFRAGFQVSIRERSTWNNFSCPGLFFSFHAAPFLLGQRTPFLSWERS